MLDCIKPFALILIASICTPIDNSSCLLLFLYRIGSRIKSFHVTENNILAIIKTDPNKAHGWDKICSHSLILPLKIIFEHCLKVSEDPFKENKNTLKIIQVLLYTHFYNIALNVLRPNFLNICNLPISHFPNIKKIRVKVGPKTNYFSYFMSSCTNRVVVFNIFFFHLYLANQETNKTVPAVFFFSNIF